MVCRRPKLEIKAHSINELNNFIAGWYIPEELCDKLLAAFIAKRDTWTTKESPKNYSGFNLLELEFNLLTEYCTFIQKCLLKYIEKYPHANLCNEYRLTEANLQCFKPGDYYEVYHHENEGDTVSVTRHLFYLTYLNTINDGGHTSFLYQDLSIKPEKGLTIISPCQWTHTHCGTYTNEEKYISTGWFNFIY